MNHSMLNALLEKDLKVALTEGYVYARDIEFAIAYAAQFYGYTVVQTGEFAWDLYLPNGCQCSVLFTGNEFHCLCKVNFNN